MALTYGHPLRGFVDRKKNPATVRSVTGPSFSAFFYKCPLNVDWDGAPNAYGLDRHGIPDQTNLDPWESPKHSGSLANARNHAKWDQEWVGIYSCTRAKAISILRQYGLIPAAPAKGPDTLSKESQQILHKFWDNRTTTAYGKSLENLAGDGMFPVVQISEMPTVAIRRGYYVSTTGWADRGYEQWDPHRYLDASSVPYSVVPALSGVGMGDYGLVIRNKTGASTPYVCGDSSGAAHGSHTLGECSGAIYIAMGLANEGDFSFIVFPHSGSGGSLADTRAAENAVRAQLGKLSGDDADDLTTQLAGDKLKHFVAWYNVRTALARWGAPQYVLTVDAVSGA